MLKLDTVPPVSSSPILKMKKNATKRIQKMMTRKSKTNSDFVQVTHSF